MAGKTPYLRIGDCWSGEPQFFINHDTSLPIKIEILTLMILSGIMKRIQICATIYLLYTLGCHFSEQDIIGFNDHIRPIFNEKCLRCHGGVKANGGLSLLFEEDAFAPAESGKTAIIRGNHQKSSLYQRLVSNDPEFRMPFEKDPLSDEEIDLIARWIDQGAPWEKHWAYKVPHKDIAPPSTDDDWAINGIDHFIIEKHKSHELTPSPAAEREVLMRRLYLDLTGLPPTLEQADQFLRDDGPDAYERLVDQLLQSPHFGERWASMWLDLARYADTKGYEKDSNRSIWKFRDWVIQAFNQDLPFDSFTIHQLAGDLLPNPTIDQLIATAYHRNAVSNDEGGTDDEEFRVASIIERVANTYEVWLSTTMACVQCHSHPYDPFRHEEFYESMAFFNNTSDKDIYNESPKLYTYDPTGAKEVEEIITWVKQKMSDDIKSPRSAHLHIQKENLLDELDYRVIEAEDYDQSSPLIELIWPNLDMVWQIQDSSWIKFEDVDLSAVEAIGFRASTMLQHAGSISIHLDSVAGEKIGSVPILKTGTWKNWQSSRPTEEHLFHEFKAPIHPVDGQHDLFFRFAVGDTYIQHLFYLDKIIFHEREARFRSLGPEVEKKLAHLIEIPAETTPILQELPPARARKTHFFNRGSWLTPEHEVRPDIPSIFQKTGDHHLNDRLGFAKWLVSPENPLTARVIVNRIWEQFFGYGIVETMEEFGSQGASPTHPMLLDWLAVRLQQTHRWSLHALIKDIVMSATYRQSSKATQGQIEKDPRNQWLARGPRMRLSAEQIRDQILAVSGLLKRQVGGPSVIIPALNINETKIPRYVVTGEDALYRRSLYVYWKRTDPFPSMITFDSPDRTVCSSRRIRTNTPLQALTLLNNQTYYYAARAMAGKMIESTSDLDQQIRHGYQRLLHREIDTEDLEALKELYREAIHHHTAVVSGEESRELAALTIVANALLNLDEFIVKE